MDTLTTHSNFWQNYFGVSKEIAFQTIIPTAITLFVFIAGLMLNRWRENSKERKKSNTIKTYIKSQLSVLIKATNTQILNLDKYLEQLRQEKIFNMVFELSVDFNAKHIRIIKSNELFNVLVIKNKRTYINNLEGFNSLIKQLDLIDGLNDSFKLSFNYTQEHLNKYQDSWNENIDIIGNLHDKWLTILTNQNIDPRNDPFLKEFLDIYHKWAITENRRDMYVAINSLINSVLEKARLLQPNLYGEALLRPLLHCLDAHANHKNLRDIKIKEYEHYKTQLQSIEKELKKINNENI